MTANAFHDHLDKCQQCRDNPFRLCDTGATLIQSAPQGQWTAEDQPLPEDIAIAEAHPMATGDHSTYMEAVRLVGAKRSKYALVDLVNWLLVEKKKATQTERERIAKRLEGRAAALNRDGKVMASIEATKCAGIAKSAFFFASTEATGGSGK